MAHNSGSDKKAAFTGLIVTAVALFIMAFTIVQLTNRLYAGHKPAAAGEAKH